MKTSAKKQVDEQTEDTEKVVDLVGSVVRWIGNSEFPIGTTGRVLSQRIPMKDWIIIYVDFREYGCHWVSAKRVVLV